MVLYVYKMAGDNVKYKDFDGKIEDLVNLKLKEIEEKKNVKILHAVESGSRSWGFASPDSDYDVRFIYVRREEDYLRLENTKDFIDWELDEVLDINGWDVKKALQHFHKSNATLFEWANSPVVYYTTEEWKHVMSVANNYFSCKSTLYHYYGTARSNYKEHLQKDMVRYKKYFYVLRPILACKWIEEKQSPPPVLFETLVNEVLEQDMVMIVNDLKDKKMQMNEHDEAPRISEVNEYLEAQLSHFKQLAEDMKDDRNPDWEELNNCFIQLL